MKQFNRGGTASIIASDSSAHSQNSGGLLPKSEQNSGDEIDIQNRISSTRARSSVSNSPLPKKRKLNGRATGSKLSFGVADEEDEDQDGLPSAKLASKQLKPRNGVSSTEPTTEDSDVSSSKPRLGANKLAGFAPKALTKHALRKEVEQREALREEFRKKQELVKEANIVVPFVFFEGSVNVTSRVKLKKGDTIDALLSGAQKILVKEDYKKWVHLKLDDLMLVRAGVMIPHYLTIHYFILKGTRGPQGPLFDFSAEPSTEDEEGESDPKLEGVNHDASLTKIVDVKWYRDHKHIYPCNKWEWFDPHDPDKDYGYASTARRDAHGNSFFA